MKQKYHGLVNQGATCYLNSVLQVLFMTKGFREAVERHTCRNPGTECMVCDLKSLFADLKGKTAHTNEITKRLGIDRVCEQRDAAEYFEKILILTSPEASQIFHGQLTHKTVCSGCRTEKNADGQFWHLPLEWVDSHSGEYSVVDGTEEYFRDAHYNGENQMYCDQCDAKSDATIKCIIKDHPESLMLLLKRFEFDYHYMTYVKNKHLVKVPCSLQIPENQTYELYAFVEHFGDLRGGHYTATIKSQDDDLWYNFNDTRVRHTEPPQTWASQSVYLLFYKKKKTHAADTCTQDVTNGGLPPASKENYDQCHGTEKMRGRGADEETEEVHHEPTEAASRNEETASTNVVSVGSLYNHQESSQEMCKFCGDSQGAHAENGQGDEGPIIRGAKEEGRTGADDQADKRAPLEERAEDQGYNPRGHHKIRQNNEGLDSVRKNINNNQEDKQEDGRDHSTEPVSVDKEGNEEMEMDVKDAEEGKSAAAGLTSRGGQDLLNQGLQDNGRIGDSKQKQKTGVDRHTQRKRTTTPQSHEGVEDQVNRADQKKRHTQDLKKSV